MNCWWVMGQESAVIRIKLRMDGWARFEMHYATSTHTSLVAHARRSWSPAVAPCLAWTSQSPRQGSPPMGGHKGPIPTQLLSRPYARPVA